ncbi:MAG: putative molybdenum carrier protein [Burkholderiales bacterium]
MRTIEIVSGGQTGVDRGALDAALAHDSPCGGWCPAGRLDELGTIPKHYPMRAMKSGGFRERTLRNVQDSDGTVIVYFDELEGGTAQTVAFCLSRKKPFKLIDAAELAVPRAVDRLVAFVEKHHIAILNVAGPRASKEPRGYDYSYHLISQFLDRQSHALTERS